jgi:hypothetical protein
MKRRSVCPLTLDFFGQIPNNESFFGVTPDDKEDLILEPAFLLMYYGGFLWHEIIHLPVSYKRWFVERIVKELTKTSESGSTNSRALHQNSPDVRALQGNIREQTPSRLRRFT